MRLPYAPNTPPSPSLEPLYSRIAARRAPRPLIPLDLALLHSPPVADGWNSFIGALRTQTQIEPSLRELAISRVAVLNSAVHEWNSHAPLAYKAGISAEGLQTVLNSPFINSQGESRGDGGLSKREWAVLAYTDQMTKNVSVDEHVFVRVKAELVERDVVELTAVVAGYNCVSRFLVALDVGENNGEEMKSVEEIVKAV